MFEPKITMSNFFIMKLIVPPVRAPVRFPPPFARAPSRARNDARSHGTHQKYVAEIDYDDAENDQDAASECAARS